MLTAAVKVNEHIETLRIKGSRFSNWLARVYYEKTKDVPGSENIKNIKSVVEAQAELVEYRENYTYVLEVLRILRLV